MITSSGFRKLLIENQNMQLHTSAVMLQLKRTSCACGFQAEDGIRDSVASRGLGDVYKRQQPALSDEYSALFKIQSV